MRLRAGLRPIRRHRSKVDQDRLVARAFHDAVRDIIDANGAFEVAADDAPDVVWRLEALAPLAVA